MILELFAAVSAVAAVSYYVKHHVSSAAVVAVKAELTAEVVKLEASAKADYSAASADVKAYVVKLEAFVASVRAKL